MTITTHVTTSGGLIAAAFIENIRQPGVEPESFALGSVGLTTGPWSNPPKSPGDLEDDVAAAWELLIEAGTPSTAKSTSSQRALAARP